MRTFPSKLFLVKCKYVNYYPETGECFLVISCEYTPFVLYEIDATIVMRGGLEKKNYILATGFTMYQASSGANRFILLDSLIALNANNPEYL